MMYPEDLIPPPDYVPEVAPQVGGTNNFLDRLAAALSQVQMPDLSRADPATAFFGGLAGGAAGGWSLNRLKEIQKREQLNQEMRKQAQERNRQNYMEGLKVREASREMNRAKQMKSWEWQNEPDKKTRVKVSPEEAQKAGLPALGGLEIPSNEYITGFRPKPESGGIFGNLMEQTDPQAIANGIINGTLPPDLSQYSRYAQGAVASILANKGYDLYQNRTKWSALQRHYASANGTIQLRLRQAAENAHGTLGYIGSLNQELNASMPRSGIKALNKVALKAGSDWSAFGPRVAATIAKMQGQVSAVQSELANVYSGGGVPTDEARKMAQEVINMNMSPAQIAGALEAADRDINIRRNAIESVLASPLVPGWSNQGGPPQIFSQPSTPAMSDEEAYQRYLQIVKGRK